MTIAFRFDASSEIGRGHAVRSMAIAENLRSRGMAVRVITRPLPGCTDPTTRGLDVHWIEPSDDNAVHEMDDAAATVALITQIGDVSWVVVDHYDLGVAWEQAVRSTACRVMVIDDLDRTHECDVRVDPNVDRRRPVGPEVVLGGPRFAALRPEFAHARAGGSEALPVGRRVLVFLGAGDPTGLTSRIVGPLVDACRDASFDIVTTADSPDLEELGRIAAADDRIELGVNVDDMHRRMERAEVMVGTAGSSSWERACLGLPSVFVTAAENQRPIADIIRRARAGVDLGSAADVDPSAIAEIVRDLLDRPSLLRRMRRRAAILCDGRGADRLAAALDAPLRLTILSDAGTWLNPHLDEIVIRWRAAGHEVRHVHDPDDLQHGDVAFFLSCSRLVSSEQLGRNAHNLVVHASDLPEGRGWSPMTWQVLAGADSIPVTLFEADVAVDSGPIYAQTRFQLQGTELLEELRSLVTEATIQLCDDFLDRYPEVLTLARPQSGHPSYFPRRRPEDSCLDLDKTLRQQFALLRVVDNDRYPAYFDYHGHRFKLRIDDVTDSLTVDP